jgi:hypothetical protein
MRPEYQIEERKVITSARANVNGHRKWIMNANAGRESIRSEWPSVFGALKLSTFTSSVLQ